MKSVRFVLIKLLENTIGRWTARSPSRMPVKKILVLQLQQLGDTLVFTPAFRTLRETHPAAQIDVLLNRVSAAVYAKCPYISTRWVDEHTRGRRWAFMALIRLLLQIRRQRYDLVIADVTQRSLRYGVVAFLTGAKVRAGFNVDGRGFLYNASLEGDLPPNVIDANLALVEQITGKRGSRDLELFYDAGDTECARSLLAKGGGAGPIVCIHPASNYQSKTWYPERWASVIDALQQRFDARVFLIGTTGEAAYIEDIRQRASGQVTSLAGLTTLPQLAAVYAQSDLSLGTDSGPRHVAASQAIPQVTVMSAHDKAERWQFNRPYEVVLRTNPACSPCFLSECGHRTCMSDISVMTVLGACERMLRLRPAVHGHVGVPGPLGRQSPAAVRESSAS